MQQHFDLGLSGSELRHFEEQLRVAVAGGDEAGAELQAFDEKRFGGLRARKIAFLHEQLAQQLQRDHIGGVRREEIARQLFGERAVLRIRCVDCLLQFRMRGRNGLVRRS